MNSKRCCFSKEDKAGGFVPLLAIWNRARASALAFAWGGSARLHGQTPHANKAQADSPAPSLGPAGARGCLSTRLRYSRDCDHM
ncbi:hypothetical protein OPV22_017733 [Ensete ventricosum]|uniref:Uncharacterized protein n=1 Tax=Ensete ventricosum TaxID=4639 RepID=A0AAV8QXW6_ENSVE|nr:hypothetical protein OPV22_017733 [Ensete ventricosum]